ncbi:MAG: TolC family protein [Bacteriovorax sp.]|nr:TolC family protein [Bacteriovorax sp.]
MKLILMGLCSLVLFSTFGTCSAEVLTWQKSIREASDVNSELSAAKSLLQSSQYQVKVSRSGFFPQVSATAGYSYDSTDAPKYYSASINASENLFSGFADTIKVNQAKYASSSSDVNLQVTKAKISFDLKSAYMGLDYSQKYIKLTEDIIKRREANLKLVQLRFESGRENIGSLNLSKAYLAQSKFDNLQARNSLDIYKSQLGRVLGRDDFDSIEVEGNVPTQIPPFESIQQLDFKNLVKNIPDYKKAFFNEQIALGAIDLSNSSFYPTLGLTQSVGRSGRESNSPNNTWAVGAAVTFPLFSGGKDYYSYKSITEDYRASAMTRKNTEEAGITKLKQAYTTYIEAVMKLEVDKAFEVASSSRERIAKAQYNNGLITFIDWDTIENDLIIRQKTLLQSYKDRVIAEASWEQAEGKGVIP